MRQKRDSQLFPGRVEQTGRFRLRTIGANYFPDREARVDSPPPWWRKTAPREIAPRADRTWWSPVHKPSRAVTIRSVFRPIACGRYGSALARTRRRRASRAPVSIGERAAGDVDGKGARLRAQTHLDIEQALHTHFWALLGWVMRQTVTRRLGINGGVPMDTRILGLYISTTPADLWSCRPIIAI